MTTVSTRDYLLFQAKRRLVPTVNNIPGMGMIEKRLVGTAGNCRCWLSRRLAVG